MHQVTELEPKRPLEPNKESDSSAAIQLAAVALCGLGYYTTKLLKARMKIKNGKSL